VSHANLLVEMTKKLKELIKTNLCKITEELKKVVEDLHSEYIKK
jgi:hypothetical protein